MTVQDHPSSRGGCSTRDKGRLVASMQVVMDGADWSDLLAHCNRAARK